MGDRLMLGAHSMVVSLESGYAAPVPHIRTLAAIFLSSTLGAGCSNETSNEVTRANCQRVRTHQADLRVAQISVNESVSHEQAERERAKHLKNFANAGGEAALETCVKERSADWVKCSLDAEDLAELHACGE